MSESKTKESKRIILPQKKPQVSGSNVILIPSIENLLSDALTVLGNELVSLKAKSDRSPGPLQVQEARVLQGYIKSLVDLSKEAREREKTVDLSDMDDSEIIESLLIDMTPEERTALFQKINRKESEDE